MKQISDLSAAPSGPAVYAMHAGTGRSDHVAYVGLAGGLRTRLRQHLERRDSSIVTGASAVSLDPDKVTYIDWWEHEDFADSVVLRAAELIAFGTLEPVLRSRGHVSPEARQMAHETVFRQQFERLFTEQPTGRVRVWRPRHAQSEIAGLAERIDRLERRVTELEASD